MNNYEAIMKMSVEQLEFFLDAVYTTGLNDGSFSVTTDDDKLLETLDSSPFNIDWLSSTAEQGILNQDDVPVENRVLLNALVQSVLRCAGIDMESLD